MGEPGGGQRVVKKVLIVDDDREMLLSLEEGLMKYDETFSILTAEDGLGAVDQLKKSTISLVVTDLKMPRMDGFSLLSHIMEHYPEIPVIIITGYSTSEMERLAREGGAIGYIAKPFMIDDLAKRIITTLRKEADGGTLHSVSSGIFLQLMEMEEKTCTVRLVEKSSGKQGVLFFLDGQLLDARCDSLRGEAAAYEIFSWDDVSLNIQNACPQRERRIHRDLQAILLDAMRLKDELRRMGRGASSGKKPGIPARDKIERVSPVERVRELLKIEVGEGYGIEDVYEDRSWESFVKGIGRLGAAFNAGEMKVAYVDRGEAKDFILLPGESVTVVAVNQKCARDRIMEALGE
jgi:DNA-binding response OmpR family regulator